MTQINSKMAASSSSRTRVDDVLQGGSLNLFKYVNARHRFATRENTAVKEIRQIAKEVNKAAAVEEQPVIRIPDDEDFEEKFAAADRELARRHAELMSRKLAELHTAEERAEHLRMVRRDHAARYAEVRGEMAKLLGETREAVDLAAVYVLRAAAIAREKSIEKSRGYEPHRRHGLAQVLGVVEMPSEEDLYLMEIG